MMTISLPSSLMLSSALSSSPRRSTAGILLCLLLVVLVQVQLVLSQDIYVIDRDKEPEVKYTAAELETEFGKAPVFWGPKLTSAEIPPARQPKAIVLGHGSGGGIAGTDISKLLTLLKDYSEIHFFACAIAPDAVYEGAIIAVTGIPSKWFVPTYKLNVAALEWMTPKDKNQAKALQSAKDKSAIKDLEAIKSSANALIAKVHYFREVINLVNIGGKRYFWCAPALGTPCASSTTTNDCGPFYLKYTDGIKSDALVTQLKTTVPKCLKDSSIPGVSPCYFYEVSSGATKETSDVALAFLELSRKLKISMRR